MKFSEIIYQSFLTIKQNGARTLITCCIIGFGIMSLVGILTAIDGLKTYINKDFSSMGANTFKIRNRGMAINIGVMKLAPKIFKPITYLEAKKFKSLFSNEYPVDIQVISNYTGLLKYQDVKSNPNVMIFGVDEDYLEVESYSIFKGRNFSFSEMTLAKQVCVLGNDVALKLFGQSLNGIGEDIIIDGRRFQVIGILESKGSSMITSDNFALIPVTNSKFFYNSQKASFVLGVKLEDQNKMESAIELAKSKMRLARKLNPRDENNFDIMKSDSFSELLVENLSYATIGGFVIGLVTLLGAAIGLMNIMLVSVTERTREIGTLKAIGARSSDILKQFLIEAIVICQLGGILGVILGIIIGNIVSLMIGGTFIIPWLWMLLGVLFCFIVGLVSGIYPALKAARQDPIEALRFE
ncbi:MAG: ABC transporter permease [Chitinophagales bacterium]|nr:ABC transporter permease [Chitinophagales bacterium]